ncbi:hypothetical protein [Emticicia sp. 17c]|uniref:hypothetical protein n=1 Tax=Emticicia sp. 17c TaxID=3127704 RepID=UPI00301D22FA
MEIKKQKPPGKRLLKNMPLRVKWFLSATIGMILVGFGLSVFSEAGHLKHTNGPFLRWFLLGTYSLIMVNSGLALFGQAIIFRMRIENRKMIKNLLKEKMKKNKRPLTITKIEPDKDFELTE